jgi:UDP-N-acetylglucosamine 2-epimerase (non-hydrolysing)
MCREVMDFFGIVPDLDLDIMAHGQTLFDLTERLLSETKRELTENPPDLLLVHGDTTTAFSASLAAFYLGVRVGHVEAGLRSCDLFSPFPEEFNRRAIDACSFLHFCPTETAKKNLVAEGMDGKRIFVTGNTIVDALKYTLSDAPSTYSSDGVRLLLTLHRRESRGKEMRAILGAVRRAAEKYEYLRVIFPAHPAKEVRDAAEELSGAPNVLITPPLPLPEFHRLINESDLILSDSGGVCEEAVSLGKPFLLARNTTERPEGVASGGVVPVGTDGDAVFKALCRFIESPEERKKATARQNPFGDGHASERIADIIASL